jgi:hypothetical protein
MDGCIILDEWQGNPNLNHPLLISSGVLGMIVRLNDMQGGHHLDKLFIQNWQLAQGYKAKAIYFVYNPWVDGVANYTWLKANLPAGYKGRIFFDVEVAYPNYSPAEYAQELLTCILLTEKNNPITIYTGLGSWALVNPWPKRDFWWAYYFGNLIGSYQNWNSFVEKVLPLSLPTSVISRVNGTIKMVQITGGGAVLPGMNGEGVDISVFLGNEQELIDYFGNSSGSVVTPEPEPTPIAVSGSPLNFKVLNNLNVRNGAGTNYPIIGEISSGCIVNAIDVGGTNCWIETDQGWVCHSLNNSKYLSKI